MNRDHFLRPIEDRDAPPWSCPKCGAGTLHINESTRKFRETPTSFELRTGGYDDRAMGICTIILECSNKGCGESFHLIGDRTYEQTQADTGELFWSSTTTPLFIQPGLEFFVPPPRCPEAVRKELAAACYLYWADPSASGNRLRAAVEVLLTELGIKRYGLSKKRKRQFLQLSARIEILRSKKHDIAETLDAIRWLGNAASHIEGLAKNDVLDGAEIIKSVLDKLYAKTDERIAKVVQQIKKRKKPRGQRAPRRARRNRL